MHSDDRHIVAYLEALPADRRVAIEAVRTIILNNLPRGYVEVMNWGMIAYEVPLAIEPKTNNGKPLMYAALASQKNYMSVYLCSLSCVDGAEEKFKSAWSAKKLDMGKSCVRFKKLEDLDQKLIAKTLAATSLPDYVAAFKARYMSK